MQPPREHQIIMYTLSQKNMPLHLCLGHELDLSDYNNFSTPVTNVIEGWFHFPTSLV